MSSPFDGTRPAGEACTPTAIHRLKTPASGRDPTHCESASTMVQLTFCEARKGVMFAFPMRRLTLSPRTCRAGPRLVGFLLHPIPRPGTRRRLMFSRKSGRPLAQGFLWPNRSWRTCRSGGKLLIDDPLILPEVRRFLKPTQAGCG